MHYQKMDPISCLFCTLHHSKKWLPAAFFTDFQVLWETQCLNCLLFKRLYKSCLCIKPDCIWCTALSYHLWETNTRCILQSSWKCLCISKLWSTQPKSCPSSFNVSWGTFAVSYQLQHLFLHFSCSHHSDLCLVLPLELSKTCWLKKTDNLMLIFHKIEKQYFIWPWTVWYTTLYTRPRPSTFWDFRPWHVFSPSVVSMERSTRYLPFTVRFVLDGGCARHAFWVTYMGMHEIQWFQ